MEFGFSVTEQRFAEEVRTFLRDHPLDRFPLDGMDAGYGSGAHSRAFMRALGERGWISMCWPASFGGRAEPMFVKLVLFEELALAGAPFGPLAGSWQTADAIIDYGSERLRRDVLPAIARGEATFWQGYSEPDAGSDLLALKTEARRDGDHYVIRGHKIWSSHAGIATHGLVFTRTSREARRSRGFSMFVVPNGTPGMDIRPIRSLTGGVYHYEVFLDDVRVPAELRLGMDLLGRWAPLRAGSREARLDGEISHAYLTSLGHTIAGGTAEVLRTTVAVRGLGLPAEPRKA